MAQEASSPARDGVAAGLGISSRLAGLDSSKNNPTLLKKQRLSAVDRARRELLLDALVEAFGDVIELAESGERACWMRDRRGVFAAVDSLVEKAILVGETKRDLHKLLAVGSGGAA
jgi:hypothetical protein